MGKKCALSNHFLIKTPITKRLKLEQVAHTRTHAQSLQYQRDQKGLHLSNKHNARHFCHESFE